MPAPRASRPRRKARQQRARHTVDVVLEAAARVLRERGYGAATTNRIAETAGVSVGTLYEYFANKDELFEALIERELDALVDAVRAQHLPADAPIGQVLAGLVSAAIGAMRYGPELFRALEQVPGAAFRVRLADARRGVLDFVRQLLETHREELRVRDLDLAAFVIVSAAEGIGGNASAEAFDAGVVEETTALLHLYLTGSEPDPPPTP